MSLFISILTLWAESSPFRVAVSEPWHTLNILNPPTLMSYRLQDLMLDRLVYWNPEKQKFESGLAEDLQFYPKQNYLKLKLKSRQTCDGRKLSTQDVVHSFELLRSDAAPFYRILLKGIARIEASAATNEIRIHFAPGKFENVQESLSSFRVLAPPAKDSLDTGFKGYGLYCLESFSEQKITFTRNAHNDGPYYFEKLEFQFVPEPNVQRLLLQKKQIDATDFAFPSVARTLAPIEKTQKVAGPPMSLRVQVNLTDSQLQDKSFRQQLESAIDKEWLKRTLFQNLADIDGFSELKTNSPPTVLPKKIDISARARQELKQINRVVKVHYDDPNLEPFLTAWQREAQKNLGLTIQTERVAVVAGNELRRKKNFQLYATVSEQIPEISASVWRSDGTFNNIGYKNPKVDKLLDEVAQSVYSTQRLRLQKQIAELIEADLPELRFLKNIRSQALVSERIDTSRPSQRGQWFFANWH